MSKLHQINANARAIMTLISKIDLISITEENAKLIYSALLIANELCDLSDYTKGNHKIVPEIDTFDHAMINEITNNL